jgi:hypothetical protein
MPKWGLWSVRKRKVGRVERINPDPVAGVKCKDLYSEEFGIQFLHDSSPTATKTDEETCILETALVG